MRPFLKGYFLLLACQTLGCESPIEFPGDPFRPELVVISEFSEHSSWQAAVQRTVDFDEVVALPAVVENATVTVTGDDGSMVELKHKGGGFYQSNCCRPKPGITYQLAADADGFAQASAIDGLPIPARIKGVRRTSVIREGRPAARLEIDFDDEGGVRNYYELSLVLDVRWYDIRFTILNAEVRDQLSDYGTGDILEPDLATIYVERLLLHDEAIDGQAFTLVLETDPFHSIEQIGGPLSVKLRTVTEAYYQYWRTRRLQDNSEGDPFVEPVRIRSNVTGGRGLFGGYAPETHGALTDAAMREQISGSYIISRFRVRQDGIGRNYMGLGGSGELNVRTDNTVIGGMQIPIDEGEPWSVSLNGGFVLRGTTIRLLHSANTVIRDMDFEFRPETNSLHGNVTIDFGQGVHVAFERKDLE